MNANPYTDAQGRVWRYGEFFPYDLCPFAYNESIAAEYMPLTEAEAKLRGFGWRPQAPSEHAITVQSGDLPRVASDMTEEALKEVIACGACGRAYRIIRSELNLLKRFGFPAPRLCQECRHRRRFARLNMPKLWHRNCAKCGLELETSYAPGRPEIVYCEQCYNAEVA
jgi:hypothetical protein